MPISDIGAGRLARLEKQMQAKGIDALICMKPQTTFYLSGFNPIIYSHPVAVVLTAGREPTLLLHALRDDHAKQSAWTSDIRLHGAWSTKKTMGQDWLLALRQIVDEHSAATATIGIEEDYLSAKGLKELHDLFPKARFVDVSRIISEARTIKDPSEIEDMRKACRIADAGMLAAIEKLKAGITERDVCNASMAAMHALWAKDYPEIEVADFGHREGGVQYALWTYSLFGERVLLNCDNPTNRRASNGEIALIIVLGCANALKSENERSVAIGELPKERRRAYDAVLEIRERTYSLIKPGTPVRELYRAARSEYQRLGYGMYMPGRIGHGTGLGHHEALSLEESSEHVLTPNMIMTYEPNLRIPEWGGLQHSDTILITETGNEFLTNTDNGFIQV